MSLAGGVQGPVYGLFLLGGLNRYANWKVRAGFTQGFFVTVRAGTTGTFFPK